MGSASVEVEREQEGKCKKNEYVIWFLSIFFTPSWLDYLMDFPSPKNLQKLSWEFHAIYIVKLSTKHLILSLNQM